MNISKDLFKQMFILVELDFKKKRQEVKDTQAKLTAMHKIMLANKKPMRIAYATFSKTGCKYARSEFLSRQLAHKRQMSEYNIHRRNLPHLKRALNQAIETYEAAKKFA